LSSRHVAKHAQYVIDNKVTNKNSLSSVQSVISNGILHCSQVVAYNNLEQESKYFSFNISFMKLWPSIGGQGHYYFQKFFLFLSTYHKATSGRNSFWNFHFFPTSY